MTVVVIVVKDALLLLLHRLMLAGLPSVSVCVCGGLPPAGFYLEPQLPPWYHNHNQQDHTTHHSTTPQPTRPHEVHNNCSILRYYLNHHQQDHNCSGYGYAILLSESPQLMLTTRSAQFTSLLLSRPQPTRPQKLTFFALNC